MTIIKGKYRVKNSENGYDIVHLETSASQVKFDDGKTFQDKLNEGILKGDKGDKGDKGQDGYTPIKGVDYFDGAKGAKGDKGDKGQDGLTTSVTVNGNKYTHSNGNITLPSYPSTPASVGAEPANSNIQAHISSTHAPANAQKNSDITKAEIEAKLTGVITSHTHNYETPANVQSQVNTALNNAKRYADEKVSSLVSSAPETLDTLQELAKALGDDPNFATTVSNKIGVKADKSYVDTELDKKADVSHGTHVVFGGNGSATTVSRSDHSHTPQTSVTGNAGTATKLATARTINGVAFDGTSNITITDSTKVSPTGTIVANRVPVFNDTTGKVIKDSGFTIGSSVPANAKFTDTVYTHPTNHPASIITQDANNRFVTDAEKSAWNSKMDKVYYDIRPGFKNSLTHLYNETEQLVLIDGVLNDLVEYGLYTVEVTDVDGKTTSFSTMAVYSSETGVHMLFLYDDSNDNIQFFCFYNKVLVDMTGEEFIPSETTSVVLMEYTTSFMGVIDNVKIIPYGEEEGQQNSLLEFNTELLKTHKLVTNAEKNAWNSTKTEVQEITELLKTHRLVTDAEKNAWNSTKTEVQEIVTEVQVIETEVQGIVTEVQEIVEDFNNLNTRVDELFQSANNGKQLIADAIGNKSITSDSTFSAMSNEINLVKTTLSSILSDNNIKLNGTEGLKELVSKIMIEDGVLANPEDIKQVACGYYHSVVLKKDGTVYVCGRNNYGQLGLGNTTTYTSFTKSKIDDVKEIHCGTIYTIALKKDNTLWGCGNNAYGQLGIGNKTNQKSWVQINIDNIKQVAVGGEQTFVLKNSGELYAVGNTSRGVLAGTPSSDGTFQLVPNSSGLSIKKVSTAPEVTHVLTENGRVYSAGYNGYDGGGGNLGLGQTIGTESHYKLTLTNVTDAVDVFAGANASFIIKKDGSVWASSTYKEYAGIQSYTFAKLSITNVKTIFCNGYSSYILKNDGTLWVHGHGDAGNFGLGNTNDQTTSWVQSASNVKLIFGGGVQYKENTFILKNDGTLWTCGSNNYGQLGLGNKNDQTSWVQINPF